MARADGRAPRTADEAVVHMAAAGTAGQNAACLSRPAPGVPPTAQNALAPQQPSYCCGQSQRARPGARPAMPATRQRVVPQHPTIGSSSLRPTPSEPISALARRPGRAAPTRCVSRWWATSAHARRPRNPARPRAGRGLPLNRSRTSAPVRGAHVPRARYASATSRSAHACRVPTTSALIRTVTRANVLTVQSACRADFSG